MTKSPTSTPATSSWADLARDFAAYVNDGSSFYGEAGSDFVLGELQGGMVFGGADADAVDQISSGTFNGEDGDDSLREHGRRHLQRRGRRRTTWAICLAAPSTAGPTTTAVGGLDGGTFNGEDGADFVGTITRGTFNGGAGNDSVLSMAGAPSFPGGTFNGEDGDDFVVDLEGGTFNGGPGVDTVTNLLGGTFNQD